MVKFSPDDLRAIATALLGEPNRSHSDRRTLRWRSKGAFALNLERGLWFDHETGEGGDIFALVQHCGEARDFRGAKTWLETRGWLRVDHTVHQYFRTAKPQDDDGKSARALAIWREARNIEGTLAEAYLVGRAIRPPWPEALRFHPALWCDEIKKPLPALVAAITKLGTDEPPHAIQRIWLKAPGRKADVQQPKKTLGSMRSGGVVLAPFRSRLLIAEGIETALSTDEHWGTSTVATLGAVNMQTLEIPPGVEDILIAFDRDPNGAGERAARALAARLYLDGRSATLIPPPNDFGDWNDFARARADG